MKLYTAVTDYFATGEGRTLALEACGALSMDDARLRITRHGSMGAYLLSGAEVFEGLPPANDYVTNYLLTAHLRQFLTQQTAKLDCHFHVSLYHHFNMS